MKRILSFVMCLCMLVGLMPAAVMASDGSATPERGLYESRSSDGTFSGLISMVQINDNGNVGYRINYSPGQELTLYYYCPDSKDFRISGNGVTADCIDNDIYTITLSANNRGNVECDFGVTMDNDDTPGFPIYFTDGSEQLYFLNQNTWETSVSKSAGYDITAVFGVPGETDYRELNDENGYTLGTNLGTLTWQSDSGNYLWDTNDMTDCSGWIWATKGTPGEEGYEYYLINARVEAAQTGGNEGGETQLKAGIYTTLTNGELSGYIDWTEPYSVSYTPGNAKTVYFYYPNLNNFTVEGNGLSASKTDYNNIYSLTLDSGFRGVTWGNFTYNFGENSSSGGKLVFNDGNQPMYFKDAEGNYNNTLVLPVGTVAELSLAVGGDTKTMLGDGYTVQSNIGIIRVGTDGKIFLDLNNASVGQGQLWATKGDEYYLMGVNVVPAMINPERDVVEEDYYVDNGYGRLAEFKVGDNAYYLGLSHHNNNGEPPSPEGAMEFNMSGSDFVTGGWDIAIFAKEGDGYTRVNDVVSSELFPLFSNLELEVKVDEDNLPNKYPQIMRGAGSVRCAECIEVIYTKNNLGSYYIEISGTINGQELHAVHKDSVIPVQNIVFTPEVGQDKPDGIKQINDLINSVDNSYTSLRITIPAGQYYGYIVIPSDYPGGSIEISGNNEVAIFGGVEFNGDNGLWLSGINFIGPGRDNAWGVGDEYTNKPNYAIYGSGPAVIRSCSFVGYNVAIHSDSTFHKNSIGNRFDNNGTALIISGDIMGIAPAMSGNLFRGNNIAMHFKNLPDRLSFNDYNFEKNIFIDNTTDIQNDAKKAIFMPGCYFGYGTEGNIVARECIYKPIGQQQGNGNWKKQVMYYPQATTTEFKEYIFDSEFYGKKDPIVSINFTKIFPIPQQYLDGNTFRIYDERGEIARIDFNTASSGSSSGARAFSARGGSSSEATFDATVELERSDNTITIKLNDFPGGKTPTVSVPNEDGWTKAAVVGPNGDNSEVSVTSDYISFVAPSGGTYTIKKVVDAPVYPSIPTPDPEPEEPTVPETPSVDTDSPVVDSTTTENEDGSTTVTEKLENGATVETTTGADGSKTETATKTETVETEEATTTTTVTATTSTAADGTVSTETKVEEVVKTETTTTATTTTTTETAEKTEKVEVKEETVVAEDGTETTTTTTTTEATLANGTTATTVVDAAGTVTAEATVSEEAIKAAAEAEAPVALPVATVSIADAATITVNTGSTETVTVSVPVADADTGTVAILVDAEGNETVITETALTEDGVSVPVPDGATIKIVDNSVDFDDVQEEDWHDDAVDFVFARGIMNGTGDNKFDPKAPTTRAMVWTMLARLDGVDTSTGSNWYEAGQQWAMENGISDGTNASAEVTREQLVTMIWRYLGEPESDHDITHFDDHHETSDWALEAKQWAVEMGIIKGVTDTTLDPGGNATRAQVAQMFMNFLGL